MLRDSGSARIALRAGTFVAAAAAVLGCAASGSAGRGGRAAAASGASTSSNSSTVTTRRVVTAPDGTTTVTEEVITSQDGRTTRTVTTRTQSGSGAVAAPLPERAPASPPVHDGTSAPARAGAAAQSGSALALEALAAHNRERRQVKVSDLAWDDSLARLAADWARHLCRSGKGLVALEHRPRGPGSAGENLWAGFSSEARSFSITEAVQAWAAERKYFDLRTGRCRGGECGHYTQVVWHSTTQVGCALATCPGSGLSATVWVCNYAPAGNFIGERPY